MILFLQSESLWSILCSPAHWIAEIIVSVVFDGLLLGLFWPMIRNCWRTWQHARPQQYDWSLNPIAARNDHLPDCPNPNCVQGKFMYLPHSKFGMCINCGIMRSKP